MNRRRVGKFRVTQEALDDNLAQYAYEGMVPLKVEHDFFTNCFEVTAISEKFDEVAQGEMAPWYMVRYDGDIVKTTDITGLPIGGHLENIRATFERMNYDPGPYGFLRQKGE
jgi:hypothetical protein